MASFEVDCPIDVLFEIFGKSVSTGMSIEAPGGFKVQLAGMPMEKRHVTHDAAPLVHLALSFGRDIAVGVFSAWLYDSMKKSKQPALRINRKAVEISENGIVKAVSEIIERYE